MSKHSVDHPVTVLLVDPGGELGGAERVIDTIAHRVDRVRFRPIVACLSEGSWPTSLAKDGIAVHTVPRGRLRDLRVVFKVVASLTASVRRERVGIVHASLASAVIYGAVAGRLGNARVIWHLHDPQGAQGLRRRVVVRTLLTLGADHIIFANPAAEKGWREILAGKDIPSSIILPGVDTQRIAVGNAVHARAYLAIPQGTPVISMFARAVHHKGHMDLIKAASRVKEHFPSCRFVICTGWTEESGLVNAMRQLVRDLDLVDTVLLPGGISEEVKFGLLVTSDAIAHPSWFEPYGLAILEGMAAGKPVVAARSEGACFLIEDGVSGLIVPPHDPEALAAALISLLVNPAFRGVLGDEARRKAAAFTNEAMVLAVEDVWDSVMAK